LLIHTSSSSSSYSHQITCLLFSSARAIHAWSRRGKTVQYGFCPPFSWPKTMTQLIRRQTIFWQKKKKPHSYIAQLLDLEVIRSKHSLSNLSLSLTLSLTFPNLAQPHPPLSIPSSLARDQSGDGY
jgi:hypothetical protein